MSKGQRARRKCERMWSWSISLPLRRRDLSESTHCGRNTENRSSACCHIRPTRRLHESQIAADALVFKPLRFEELASRLKLVLGRNSPEVTNPIVDRRHRGRRKEDREAASNPRSSISSLQVKEREKVVLYRGRELQLSRKEYLLLSLLASEPGRVFSKEEIIARLWPTSRRAAATDVQQYVCLLRKKIESDPSNPCLIKTVPSFGYKLDPPEEM